MSKPIHVLYDKVPIKGHTYTIVLIPSRRLVLLLWNSTCLERALYLNYIYDYETERVRGLIQTELEGDLIRQMIEEDGLILPTERFYSIEIPYQAIYEGVLSS